MDRFQPELLGQTPTGMPDAESSAQAEAYLEECMQNHNSAGGVVECVVNGVPAGIGEPVFDKLDACLAKAIMSVGAVKAVEIGDGCSVSTAAGTENNDAFYMENGQIAKKQTMPEASWAASATAPVLCFGHTSNPHPPFFPNRKP